MASRHMPQCQFSFWECYFNLSAKWRWSWASFLEFVNQNLSVKYQTCGFFWWWNACQEVLLSYPLSWISSFRGALDETLLVAIPACRSPTRMLPTVRVWRFTLSSGGRGSRFLSGLVSFLLSLNHYRQTSLLIMLHFFCCSFALIILGFFPNALSFSICLSRPFLPLHFPSALVTSVCRLLCVCWILQLSLENVEVILLTLLGWKKKKIDIYMKAGAPNGPPPLQN